MKPETSVDDLVRTWRKASRDGAAPAPEELCHDCPELLDALKQAIDALPDGDKEGDPTSGVDGLGAGPRGGLEPVPGYVLTRLLGRGGFGEVWEARAPGGLHVAFKFVPLEGQAGELELRALDIVRGLRHPNLLTLFGTWQVEGWLVIGMELADGTLHDALQEQQRQGRAGLPRRSLFRHVQDAARVIDFLNKPRHFLGGPRPVGIQHGDVKPQNILLVGGGVKVGDFGLVQLLEKAFARHAGGLSVSYAAPELLDGRVSHRSDQYALAVTWCQLRGGRLPFTGTRDEVMAGHRGGTPDLGMVPAEERPALERALAKDPRRRWPSCRAFLKALADAQGGAPARLRGVPASPLKAAPAPPPTEPEAPRSEGTGQVLAAPDGATYRLLGVEGQGSFGTVYRAEGPGGVAVEVRRLPLPPGDAGAVRSQAAALAGLRHPYLLRIDAAWVEGDRLIVVAERTEGTLAARGALPPAELARCLREVALALEYLHGAGRTHGGVTPDAVSLTGGEARLGPPPPQLPTSLSVTRAGAAPAAAYLAPEQTAGAPPAPSADVYALGAVLYRGLTGRPPFQAPTLPQVIAQVRRDEPVPPQVLQPAVPAELAAICLKCLAKEPARRYASAADLVADLGRFLAGAPASATTRPTFWSMRSTMPAWAGPVPGAAAVGESSLALLPASGLQPTAAGETARLEGHTDAVWTVAVSPCGRLAASGGLDGNVCLWQAPAWRELCCWDGAAAVTGVAFSPDGGLVLSGGLDGVLRLRRVPDGQETLCVPAQGGPVFAVAFAPDGRHFLSAGEDGTLRLWDAAANEVRRCEGHAGRVLAAAFTPDGQRALSAGQDGSARAWDLDGGREACRFAGHDGPVRCLAASPDGRTVATGGDDGTVRLWDLETGRELRRLGGHGDWVRCLAWLPDGRRVLSGGDDEVLRLWDADGGALLRTFENRFGSVLAVALTPDGRFALSGGDDQGVRVWDLSSPVRLRS
jgi:serine/threonine protein kinase